MLLKIVYLLTCRVLNLAVLVFRGDRAKDALTAELSGKATADVLADVIRQTTAATWFATVAHPAKPKGWDITWGAGEECVCGGAPAFLVLSGQIRSVKDGRHRRILPECGAVLPR